MRALPTAGAASLRPHLLPRLQLEVVRIIEECSMSAGSL